MEDIEEEDPVQDNESQSPKSGSPQNGQEANGIANNKASDSKMDDAEQGEAVRQLRTHETMALFSTFLFPAIGAYLLHVIRGQLSRPSTGLVSDYNLSIFLLAAEIRPCRQVIRLITNRTLHLQRIASGKDSFENLRPEGQVELASRIEALEAQISEQPLSPTSTLPQKEDLALMQTDIRKRYEPRLDALERAVRRYEKRATTLTLLTEQRLQSLETRLQDALSLAAVAAQSSQKPGVVSTALSWISQLMMIPLEICWLVLIWPLKVIDDLLRTAASFVVGPNVKSKKRAESRSARSKGERKKEDMYSTRKS